MPPRFLCLPGYLQSGKIFAEKSSGLRKSLTKKKFELLYIDPPVVIKSKEELPFKLSEDEAEANVKWNSIVEQGINRAWWKHLSALGYEGFQESLDYLTKYIKENGPFDGIIGFSQGAAMALIMTNSISKLLDQEFKIAIFFSGFVFTDVENPNDDKISLNYDIKDLAEYQSKVTIVPGYKEYYLPGASTLSTKIINIYGSEDATVPAIRSEYLTSIYSGKASVEEYVHDGGHYLPNKKQFLNPIVESVVNVFEEKASL